MEYQFYEASDFVADESFQDWVYKRSADSAAFWESWLLQHPEKQETIAEARQMLQRLTFEKKVIPAHQVRASWTTLRHRLAQADQASDSPAPRRGRFTWGPQVLRWAAAAVVILSLMFYGYQQYIHRTITHTTAYGETKTLHLPDGSTVVLNARSSLSYPARWAFDQPRRVSLSGEAFFSVRHQPNHQRFEVQASDRCRVEVLGTTFTVLNRQNRTRVVLNTGKIQLHLATSAQPQPLVVMKPGELIEFGELPRQIVKRNVDPRLYSSWKDQKLILSNTPMATVAQVIEDTYGLKVHFADPAMAGIVLNGTSIPTNNRAVFFEALSKTLNVRIIEKDDSLVFTRP